jgi:hypothetical protein
MMSILDALRVQKANQQSVSQLAALPQNEIIRLAQMGQIPADVVPVVINEKARMAKEEANMRAAMQMQQQGRVPTVIEQAMQANAQAESPTGLPAAMPPAAMQMPAQSPMPPQGQPPQGTPPQGQEQGVAALPTGDMFQGQNFQAGGIVAFNGEDGSFVRGSTDMMIPREEAQPPGQGPASLAEFINQYKGLTAGSRTESPEEIAYREAVKKGSLSPEDIKQQQWMRMFQAGLGIMGGESPYAFTNIGKGSQEALKGYAEDLRAQQGQRMLDLKTAAESARAKRSEELQDVQGGAKLYESYLDRELREKIAKDSQLGAKYADNYVAMKKASGDKRPEEVIRDEGFRTFFQEYGYASGRAATTAATAAAAQGVQATGQERSARETALREWNDLKISDPSKMEHRRLAKKDQENAAAGNPTRLAEQYENDWVGRRAQRIIGAPAEAPAQAAPAAPAAAPGAAAGRTRPDISRITGAPSGSSVGNFVQGKGWEIKDRSGKLIGYAPVTR